MGLRIAIDTGGTFTDVVAIDEATGDIASTKTPSTPEDLSVGLIEGVRKVLAAVGAGPVDVHMLLHGSTVATKRCSSTSSTDWGCWSPRASAT